LEKGTVIKSTGNRYSVRTENGDAVVCGIKGRFRIKGIRATNPVAVGDRVEFIRNDGENTGMIIAIEERSNYIIRRSSNLSREYQLLACNVDLAWLMVTVVQPRTLTAFIDRFLVSAEAYRIPVMLLFNKTDLHGKPEQVEMQNLQEIYGRIGYRYLELSLVTGRGLEEVRTRMKNRLNVLAGHSGVGKSTLINALDPSLELRIGDISEYHQAGKHTTTFAEMFELEGDIRIIDTPGIRGFGTIDIDRAELFHFFPEIFRASGHCRYHNCMHINEPGCRVKEEVSEGHISQSRYFNYVMMMEEEDGKYR